MSTRPTQDYDLLGIWYNELKSTLTIARASDGELLGTYNSVVGDAKHNYSLSGRYDAEGRTLGWAVSWLNQYHHSDPPSTTTWSGQYQIIESGQPEILTTWLLTIQTTPDFNWNSTMWDLIPSLEACLQRKCTRKPWNVVQAVIPKPSLLASRRSWTFELILVLVD